MHDFFQNVIKTPIGVLNALFLDGDLIGLYDSFEKEQKQLFDLKRKYNLEFKENKSVCLSLKKQIDEYFSGKRFLFTVPINPQTTPFRLSVYEKILKIEYGSTMSYKDIANLMFCKAYRAIGSAVKSNPLPLIIPCHRVVGKTNPNLFSLFDGEKTKLFLLNLEKKYKPADKKYSLCENNRV